MWRSEWSEMSMKTFSGSSGAEQALGADSPGAGFLVKLRGRAAQAQRSVLRYS